MCKKSPEVREHHLAQDNGRQFSMRDSQRDLSIRESGVQGFEMRCSVPEASKRDYILMQDLVNTAVFKTFLIVIFHQWVGSCSGLTQHGAQSRSRCHRGGGRLGSRRQFGLRIQGFGLHD